jgi:hypothetical protein
MCECRHRHVGSIGLRVGRARRIEIDLLPLFQSSTHIPHATCHICHTVPCSCSKCIICVPP